MGLQNSNFTQHLLRHRTWACETIFASKKSNEKRNKQTKVTRNWQTQSFYAKVAKKFPRFEMRILTHIGFAQEKQRWPSWGVHFLLVWRLKPQVHSTIRPSLADVNAQHQRKVKFTPQKMSTWIGTVCVSPCGPNITQKTLLWIKHYVQLCLTTIKAADFSMNPTFTVPTLGRFFLITRERILLRISWDSLEPSEC